MSCSSTLSSVFLRLNLSLNLGMGSLQFPRRFPCPPPFGAVTTSMHSHTLIFMWQLAIKTQMLGLKRWLSG